MTGQLALPDETFTPDATEFRLGRRVVARATWVGTRWRVEHPGAISARVLPTYDAAEAMCRRIIRMLSA